MSGRLGLVRCLVLIAGLAAAGNTAGRSGRTPLPPPRPVEVSPASSPEPPPLPAPKEPIGPPAPATSIPVSNAAVRPAPSVAVPPASAGDCLSRLRAAGHDVEPAPPTGAAGWSCAIDAPVRLRALASGRDGRRIKLPDGPVVACALAEPFATWLARVAAPVLQAGFDSQVVSAGTGPGYECRGRNRQAGAKPSAHGRGLAVDIAGFDLANGRHLPVTWLGDSRALTANESAAFQAIRVSACGWFTTVLGPGADTFHADNLHLDIERHGSSDRYRICQ